VIFAVLLLVCGLALLSLIPLARYLDSLTWRSRLVAHQLHLPSGLTVEQAANWISHIQAVTHAPRYSLLPLGVVALELVADAQGIRFYLLTARQSAPQLLSGVKAALPAVRVEAAPKDFVRARPSFKVGAELGMTHLARPLNVDQAESFATAFLSSLQPLGPDTTIKIQWLLTSAGTPKAIPSRPVLPSDPGRRLTHHDIFQDSEEIRAARAKQRYPLLHASCRVGIAAPSRAMAYAVLGRVWGTWHLHNAPSVRLVRRWLPSAVVVRRLVNRSLPVVRYPLLLNSREAASLVGLPTGNIHTPGLALGRARQLPAPLHMPTKGQVIAVSNHMDTFGRPLALTAEDRTRHSYVVGPSGSGKTVLLTRLILNDIVAGHGVFACDPKGGLIKNVLARLDEKDMERVVVLDASRRDQPIGLNVLGGARSEAERELLADSVLNVFREMWKSFWGPRSDSVMRAALASLIAVPAPDGTAMTICEIVPVLSNPAFRRYVITHPKLPPQFRDFWQRFNSLSESEAMQWVGPVIGKVEAFTQRSAIRLMLGQANGISFIDIFQKRRAVLVNLAKGELGVETGNLLGALVIAQLWKATLGQVRISPERRPYAFAYIDEAQDIVRLPLSMADMLAQAREFKLGITLANQYLAQLPDMVRAAVLGTIKTQIAFAVEREDARLLAQRFAPLTADELSGLPAFELAMRPCVGAQTLTPVTGTSLPLDEPRYDPAAVAAYSRKRYGRPRAMVEQAISSRLQVPRHGAQFGQEVRP
jgi:hypothetical protein